MQLPRPVITLSIIIACIAIALLTWAAYGWVVFQTVSLRSAVAGSITTRDTTAAKIAYSESLRSLLRDTADGRAQLAQISMLSAVDLVDRVHTLAADANVDASIDMIAPATITSSAAVLRAPALTLSISAKGTFAHLYTLIQLIETMPLAMIIDQVSLEHGGDPKNPWTLRARVLTYTESSQ